MQPVYLVIGVPGAGKTWVCKQLGNKFTWIPHDRCWKHPTKKPTEEDNPEWATGAVSTHLETILEASKSSLRPVITEVPFAERTLKEQIEAKGIQVIPYFVIEGPYVCKDRYQLREKKPYPKANFTRAITIKERADEWGAPQGTSAEVLSLLRLLIL